MYPSEKVAREAMLAHFEPHSEDILDAGADRKLGKRCKISFRKLVILSIVLCVVCACGVLVTCMFFFAAELRATSSASCDALSGKQAQTVKSLINKGVTHASFTDVLSSIKLMVEEFVKVPADSAVDSLMGSMLTKHELLQGWDARELQNRAWVAHRAYVELAEQWRVAERWIWPVAEGGLGPRRAADVLSVTFSSGEIAGIQMSRSDERKPLDCSMATGTAPVFCGPCYGKGFCESVTASRIDASRGTSETTRRAFYLLNTTSGEKLEDYPYKVDSFNFSASKSYSAQASIAEDARRSPGGAASQPAQRVWSEVHLFEVDGYTGYPKLSWTAPIAYCGDYSCFEGSVGADVVLRYVGTDCYSEWAKLADLLRRPAYNFSIGPADSSVFIVHHTSRYEDQQGLLIGASNDINGEASEDITGRTLVHAEQSGNSIVRDTSAALLKTFGSWNSTELQSAERVFNFSLSRNFAPCPGEIANENGTDCLQVGTLSVRLDDYTRWLIVTVVPAGAFDKRVRDSEQNVDDLILANQHEAETRISEASWLAIWIFVMIVGIAGSIGGMLGCVVSHGLSNLCEMMHGLGNLDVSRVNAQRGDTGSGQRAVIKDIDHLQEAFACLLDGVQAFTKFVPESVVSRIVQGDAKATRLHVKDHEVTCMFAVIAEFASICEKLSESQVLAVMRQYHERMTDIVKQHEGMVTEILDDGLLVYWNMPDDPVAEHPTKAADCALAQIKAMERLNLDLAKDKDLIGVRLPTLKLQIGFHTGTVLAGNLGSNMKMKFGSMGDAINLASRLMCLCKHWGVSTICSGEVADRLPRDMIKRELALVKVKGKKQATRLFEVFGRDVVPPIRNQRVSFGTEGTHDSAKNSPTGLQRLASRLSSPSFYARRSPSRLSYFRRAEGPSPTSQGDGSPRHSPLQSPTSLPALSGARGPSQRSQRSGRSARSGASPFRAGSMLSDLAISDVGEDSDAENRSRSASPSPSRRVLGAAIPRSFSRKSLRLPALADLTRGLGSMATLPTLLVGQWATDQGEGDPYDVSQEQKELAQRYEEALHSFQRAEFAEAHRIVIELIEMVPDDVPTQRLLERTSERMAADGTALELTEEEKAEWTGVYVMTNK